MSGPATETVLEADDLRFPASLRLVEEPPRRLFLRGDLTLLARPMVAVVGSRTPSRYGERIAYRAAYALARAGVVVVSGLARGLDARAHRGALDAGGQTIAVLGCGLDVPYPRGNADLRGAIPHSGLLLTEYPSGSLPLQFHFPARNRLIAGLARCLVVVEGKVKGGTSNTVDWTLRQGKSVLAVPGHVDEPEAAGPNLLITNGARPFLSPRDVLDELKIAWMDDPEDWPADPMARGPAPATPASDPTAVRAALAGAEARLYDLISPEPAHVDQLAARAHLEPSVVLAALSSLELQGLIAQLPGKRFALSAS